MNLLIEDLGRPEKDRLIHWLRERIRFRNTSIFEFDNGEQVGEAGLMRSISLTSSDKLRKIAKILDVPVYTTSYSNIWWKDTFEFEEQEFMALRRKERIR